MTQPDRHDIFERALHLRELLIDHATTGFGVNEEYAAVRRELHGRPDLQSLTPSFVRSCRTLSEFADWIGAQTPEWEKRRAIIRAAFEPLLNHLEAWDSAPADQDISGALKQFDEASVHAAWVKARDRRKGDPEGAITAARALLEAVCKRILEDAGVEFGENDDLPKLYGKAAESLRLAPNQHTEPVFKAILGSCQALVNGLGTVRNRIGDAHGRSRPVKVAPRHAALAVNLAGAMATFLIETSAERAADRKRAFARFTPAYLEAIRARLPVSAVVGKKVRLKKAGREWRGLSPFNAEKTPSFYVNDQKQFYHCFTSGKHGDIFTFLMETEGVTFPEAVTRLAAEAGLSKDAVPIGRAKITAA